MAESLLKAWDASPIVSAVEIDAASKQVAKAGTRPSRTDRRPDHFMVAEGCGSAHACQSEGPVAAHRARRGAATMDLALKSSDFVEALNQETLRVRGLDGARYTLKINGSVVGSFSREQLEQGVNLAGLPTPMAKQSLGVHLLT